MLSGVSDLELIKGLAIYQRQIVTVQKCIHFYMASFFLDPLQEQDKYKTFCMTCVKKCLNLGIQ